MGIHQGRRPRTTRMNVLLLAAAFVSLLSWSPSSADSQDPTTAGSRMLAPGLENGVLRAAPAVARAEELDRSLDRRSFTPPSALVPLTALALGLIFLGHQSRETCGNRRPPGLCSRIARAASIAVGLDLPASLRRGGRRTGGFVFL